MPKGTGTQAASSVETVSGIFQAKPSGVARRAACEPSSPTVTARSPTAKPADVGPDLGHRAGTLVADHVGHPGQVPAQPVEGVATLNADGLDVDEDVARAGRGIGHVLVAEDVGCAGLVVHRCFHDRTYSRIRKRRVLWPYPWRSAGGSEP